MIDIANVDQLYVDCLHAIARAFASSWPRESVRTGEENTMVFKISVIKDYKPIGFVKLDFDNNNTYVVSSIYDATSISSIQAASEVVDYLKSKTKDNSLTFDIVSI